MAPIRRQYLIFCFLFGITGVTAQKDSVYIKSLLDKAYEHEAAAPQTALKMYREAYRHSVKSGYHLGTFKALQYSGLVHSDNGNYDSASYYFKKSLPYSLKAGYKRGEGLTYNNLANNAQFRGDYKGAITYYLKGITIFEAINDSAALSQSYQNLSAMYDNIKDRRLELVYLKKALHYVSAAQTEQKALLYGDVGITLLTQDRPAEALLYFKKAQGLTKIDSSKRIQFFANRNFGEYYKYIKQYAAAINYYVKALELSGEQNDLFQKNDLLYIISGLYLETGNYNQALKYGMQSAALAKQIKAKDIGYRSCGRLAKIYEALGNNRLAYNYLQQSITLKDSVVAADYLKQISLYQSQFESEKKDNAIAGQQILLKKKEVEVLANRNRFVYSLAGMGFLIMLSVGVWFSFRQRQKIKDREIIALQQKQEIVQLEALLDGQEKERKRIAQELHDGINGDLSAIKYRISGIEEYGIAPDEKKDLQKIIEMLDHACTQVRSISHNLMPASIIDFGLNESVKQYCSKISATNETNIDFQYFGVPRQLPKNAETTIYRIIQELINNIIKHAQATHALVQLNFHEAELSITVEDNGMGFDPKTVAQGLGLKNIRSRVQVLNADLDISSSSKGTSFLILIDLNHL